MSAVRRTVSLLRNQTVEPVGEIRWSDARGVEFIDLPERFVEAFGAHGALLHGELVMPYHGRDFLDAVAAECARSSTTFIGDEETIADPEEP